MQSSFRTITAWLTAALVSVAFVSCQVEENPFSGRAVSQLVLHEGLPHQHYEHEALEAELENKPIHTIEGYPFYQEPLELTDEDAEQLADILTDPSTLQPFSGEKKCGGFHPDYAASWKSDSSQPVALICFGCNEAKLFKDNTESRHDLGPRSQELRDLLTNYRKNRPNPIIIP